MWKWFTDLIRQLIMLTAFTADQPVLFGPVHCILSAGMMTVAAVSAYRTADLREEKKIRLIHTSAVILLICEIWKQLFVYYVVNNESFSWWYFPFQLCSMPMYLGLLLPYVKEQGTILRFLGGYGTAAGLTALIYPADMLRIWPVFTLHGFIWHGIILFMGFTALRIRSVYDVPDRKALCLFLGLAGIAEILNTAGNAFAPAGTLKPDFFYISPFQKTTQPLFAQFEKMFGRPAEIVFYLICISAAAALIWKAASLSKMYSGSDRRDKIRNVS